MYYFQPVSIILYTNTGWEEAGEGTGHGLHQEPFNRLLNGLDLLL